MSLEVAFTEAQYAALKASEALAEAMGLTEPRVYRVLPTGAKVPYVVVGEDQLIDDSLECEGNEVEGAEIFSTVHVWTKPDPPEALSPREIAAVVRKVLKTITIPGYRVMESEFEDVRYLTDPDQSTHAVISHRYVVEPL